MNTVIFKVLHVSHFMGATKKFADTWSVEAL